MHLPENIPNNNEYSTGPRTVTCFAFDLKENGIIIPNGNFVRNCDFTSNK